MLVKNRQYTIQVCYMSDYLFIVMECIKTIFVSIRETLRCYVKGYIFRHFDQNVLNDKSN